MKLFIKNNSETMRFLLFYVFLLMGFGSHTQISGLIVNEFSNGDSGSREYMEFLVIGTPCTTFDLRGWIFDDNNGLDDITCEGFSTSFTGVGIASGHARFRYIDRWSAVPVGSIILVYNSVDKNLSITLPDDTIDINSDFVYVLPITDSGLEYTTSTPKATTSNCSYTGAIYTTPPNWSSISLNNSTDACQTRRPDGSYFHGFSYGSASSNMTGGPDDLLFTTSGGDKNFYLNCGHQLFITDYSMGDGDITDGTSDETPGDVNNILNGEFVDYYRGTNGCGVGDACVTVLPIELIEFYGINKGGVNNLNWTTATEINNDYKLTQVDFDGVYEEFMAIAIDNRTNTRTKLRMVNTFGQDVDKYYKGFVINQYDDGTTERKLQ